MHSHGILARGVANMSKRKDPEGEAPAGAPAVSGAAPPRLGDHSAYMPEALLSLADVHIKVRGGSALPAHALKLVESCGVLTRSPELFSEATSKAPVALSAPFDEYAEADVARFLKCIYNPADATARGEDVARPAVVRLAHALDAAPVLAAARFRLVQVLGRATVAKVAETEELAALCGWDDVRAETVKALVAKLQAPSGAHAATLPLLSDVEAIALARSMMDDLPAELAASAFGTLAANMRRVQRVQALHGALLSPDLEQAALVAARGGAFEIDGRFAAVMKVPGFTKARPTLAAAFKSRGLEWEVVMHPNGTRGDAKGCPAITLALLGGWPKKVRYSFGFIDPCGGRRSSASWECRGFTEYVFTAKFRAEWTTWPDLTPASFRADYVYCGLALPFVRIVEVSDPTPAEVAAAEAENAARDVENEEEEESEEDEV